MYEKRRNDFVKMKLKVNSGWERRVGRQSPQVPNGGFYRWIVLSLVQMNNKLTHGRLDQHKIKLNSDNNKLKTMEKTLKTIDQ